VDASSIYIYSRLLPIGEALQNYGWSGGIFKDYTVRVSDDDNFIVPVACDNDELLEIIPASSIELRHRLRRQYHSGNVIIPPIVSDEVCRTCGWIGEPVTDWSFVWVTPFLLFGSLVFVVGALRFRSDIIYVGNKIDTKWAIITVIALIFPPAAIIAVTVAIFSDPVVARMSDVIIFFVLAILALVPFSLIFYSTRGKYILRRTIGILLGAGMVIGFIIGGNNLRWREFDPYDYVTGTSLIISGILYGLGCIMALISHKMNKAVGE